MKKPYMKKIGVFSGYKVWYVNGFWIRKNLDPEFTNFGSNRYFHFIPKEEFWIDKENGKREASFFIDNFLIIQKELEKGKTYPEAVEVANKLEKIERLKVKSTLRLKKLRISERILKKIHKKRLFHKYTRNLNIYVVRGDLVRSLFFLDFTQGGHDKVYSFIPKNEVWIDDDVYKKEIPFVLIHELHERKLMARGWQYDPGATGGIGVFSRKPKTKNKSAHFHAEDLESWCRHHPRSIKRVLLKEIRENEKLSKN